MSPSVSLGGLEWMSLIWRPDVFGDPGMLGTYGLAPCLGTMEFSGIGGP